ncbi:hypothetical protein ACFQ07_22935, partial [Actinomadura adrarensis]
SPDGPVDDLRAGASGDSFSDVGGAPGGVSAGGPVGEMSGGGSGEPTGGPPGRPGRAPSGGTAGESIGEPVGVGLGGSVDPALLVPPVNLGRLLLHPRGLASRIVNLDEWAWHVVDAVRQQAARNPSERMRALVAELEALVPGRPPEPGPNHLGFAVPLRLRSTRGELRLLSTITQFGTAVDVTVAELRLEAFLPADEETANALHELGRSAR